MQVKQSQIVIAIIRNAQNEVFLSRRKAGTHLAGYWEFPGGKVEQDEEIMQALIRELDEEVDIQVRQMRYFHELTYSYPDRQLHLIFFLVEEWQGIPRGKEGQETQWQPIHRLDAEDFPEANQPVISRLLSLSSSENGDLI